MRRNIFIAVISVLFAIFAWLYVNLSQSYSIDLSVPLKIKLSNKQALSEELPESIDLTLKGKGWDLISLILGKNLTYNLDLTNYKRNVKISSYQAINDVLNLPPGVSVLSIYPDTLNISFDNYVEKYVKVKSAIVITPKEGHLIIGVPKLSPDSVKISGANSFISNIKYLVTEYKVFDNVSGKFQKTVSIKDTLSNIVKVEPKFVTITCDVDLAAEKSFEDVTVKIKNVPDDKEVSVIPPKISITLRSGVDELSKINPEDINVSVEYSSLENDSTGFVTPVFEMKNNISILNFTPQLLKYIIKKKQ